MSAHGYRVTRQATLETAADMVAALTSASEYVKQAATLVEGCGLSSTVDGLMAHVHTMELLRESLGGV